MGFECSLGNYCVVAKETGLKKPCKSRGPECVACGRGFCSDKCLSEHNTLVPTKRGWKNPDGLVACEALKKKKSEASSKRPPAPSKRNHAALLDPAHLFDDFPDDDDDEDDSKRRRPVPPPPLTTEDLTLLTAAALELVGCPAGWKATDDQMRQLFDDAIRVGSALAITAGLGDGVHFDLRGEVICARCSHSMDLRGFAVVDESGAFDHSQVVCRSCCWTLEEAHEVPLGRNAQPERIKALVAQWERTKLLPLPEIILMEEVIPCVYPVGMRLPVGGEERLYVTEDEICDMVTDFARHDKGLYGKAVELAAEAQSGGYVQVNVPDRSEVVARLNGAMEAMRRCRSVKANRRMELLFWEVTRQFLCRDSTCLLLLTLSEGTGTRPHADPTEALNFAVAVLVGAAGEELKRQISSGARPVLASWLFVHPSLAEEVSALYQYLGYAHAGFATPEKNAEGTMLHQAADQALFDAVLRRFGNRVIAGQSGVFVLEQRVGDMVMVPPGWVHTVINRLPCVKLAWDRLDWRHTPAYAESSQRVGSGVCHTGNSADYMAAASATINVLLRAVTRAEI